MKRFVLCVAMAICFDAGAAGIQVFSCEPEWASLVEELAGDRATSYTATTAAQDPHFIQARPSLIAQIRRADLLVCSGAQLESAWLPLLVRRSGNSSLAVGEPAHFLAADHVRTLEIPTQLDRSQGDVHPEGNPHVHLNPHNILLIARALSRQLQQVDPENRQHYGQRLRSFEERWSEAIDHWESKAEKLAGIQVITHHRSFSYLANWLKLDVLTNIEPKPGIPPSGAQLARLVQQFESNPPAALLRTPYADSKPSEWLSSRFGSHALQLPYTTGGDGPANLFELFDQTINQLLSIKS